MKNAIKTFGIIAIVAVIGLSMITCDKDGDDTTGGNGGGGDPIKAKFVGTDWVNGKLKLSFREVTSGGNAGKGYVNLNFYNSDRGSSAVSYFQITKFETDKFIEAQYGYTHTIDYTLSSDGKTLTLINVDVTNDNSDLYKVAFTKVP
jgi:hypothetical protein